MEDTCTLQLSGSVVFSRFCTCSAALSNGAVAGNVCSNFLTCIRARYASFHLKVSKTRQVSVPS